MRIEEDEEEEEEEGSILFAYIPWDVRLKETGCWLLFDLPSSPHHAPEGMQSKRRGTFEESGKEKGNEKKREEKKEMTKETEKYKLGKRYAVNFCEGQMRTSLGLKNL